MQQEHQIQVSPEVAQNEEKLKLIVAKKCRLRFDEINHVEILKRSIDARKSNVKINLRINVFIREEFVESRIELPNYKDVSKAKEVPHVMCLN